MEVDELVLLMNQFVFDGDWKWQIEHTMKFGSEEQKKEDIPLIKEMREKYKDGIPKEFQMQNLYAQSSEEIKKKVTITDEEEEYSEILSLIEAGLAIAAGNGKTTDFELIESLKLLKQNIEFGTKNIDETGVAIKFMLLPGLQEQQITRHEVALCIQYFIKMAKNIRSERGKRSFVTELRRRADEIEGKMKEEMEESDAAYDEFENKEIDEKYEYLMSVKEPDEHEWIESELHFLGIMLTRDEDYEKAEKLFKKGTLMFPQDPFFHHDMGMLNWIMSNFKESEKWFVEAQNKSKDHEQSSEFDLFLASIEKNLASVRNGEEFKEEEEEPDEDAFWEEESFAETLDSSNPEKMKTFHKKHDEDLNFSCRSCSAKISTHNKDWHSGMCDDCFEKNAHKASRQE